MCRGHQVFIISIGTLPGGWLTKMSDLGNLKLSYLF